MRSVLAFLASAVMCLGTAHSQTHRDSTASIRGRIRSDSGWTVDLGVVRVAGSDTGINADSVGRFQVRGLAAGAVRISAYSFGYRTATTTLSLKSGETVTWNPALHAEGWYLRERADEAAFSRQRRVADSTNRANGAVDLIADRSARVDTTLGFTYSRFGTNLLRAVASHSKMDSSIVLSPLSAGQDLAMLLGGAEDSTARAIRGALELRDVDLGGIAEKTRRFNESLRSRKDVALSVANALWVDTSASLQRRYQEWASSKFFASVRTVPLTVASVVPLINRWADSTTNGAIHELRKKPFEDSTVLVLLNAVYFKGLWLQPFDAQATKPTPFTTARGERVVTPMMDHTSELMYARRRNYQVARVPYRQGLTALYILLPDTGTTALAVLDELARTGWPVRSPDLHWGDVRMRLPRLHIEQSTDLVDPFKRMGLQIIFDSTQADFGKMFAPNPRRLPPCPPNFKGPMLDACTRFRVSEAMQKVFLDVDERGTTAAAVTAISMEAVPGSVPPPPVNFLVDHPFLLLLRDERSGTFLFVGLIVDPRQ
jgi:serpin B